MPSVARALAFELPIYRMAELIEQRRNALRYVRSDRHRQVALSLRALLKSEKSLQSHALDGAQISILSRPEHLIRPVALVP